MGVSVERGLPFAEQIVRLADQVQEWAVEALWSARKPAVWPECPDHPDSHPLVARLVTGADAAVWCCPRTNAVKFPIGRLPVRPSPS